MWIPGFSLYVLGLGYMGGTFLFLSQTHVIISPFSCGYFDSLVYRQSSSEYFSYQLYSFGALDLYSDEVFSTWDLGCK